MYIMVKLALIEKPIRNLLKKCMMMDGDKMVINVPNICKMEAYLNATIRPYLSPQ